MSFHVNFIWLIFPNKVKKKSNQKKELQTAIQIEYIKKKNINGQGVKEFELCTLTITIKTVHLINLKMLKLRQDLGKEALKQDSF